MTRPFMFAVFLAVLVLLAGPAHAYVDPGAGSLILQLIIGGIGGAFVAFKLFWGRIRNFRRKPEQPPE
jgi:hypothetical protein